MRLNWNFKHVTIATVMLTVCIAAGAALAGGGPPPLVRDGRSGTNRTGSYEKLNGVDYPMALTGFYYDFVGSNTDHHIERVEAIARQGFGVPWYYHAVTYADGNGGDIFHWTLNWQELPAGSTIHAISGTTGIGFNKLLGTADELPGIPVLVGFRFGFLGGDRHLRRIEARVFYYQPFDAVYAELVLEDNGKPDFEYDLVWAMIPRENVVGVGCVDGISRSSATREIDAAQPFLQGFDINYTGGDHHMDRFGVLFHPWQAEIWFRDRNGDDDFAYRVWYVDAER